jgi:hypothetical protein
MSRAQNASKNEKSEKHGTKGNPVAQGAAFPMSHLLGKKWMQNELRERLGHTSELGGIRNPTSNGGGVNGVRQKRFLSALDSVSLSPLPLP